MIARPCACNEYGKPLPLTLWVYFHTVNIHTTSLFKLFHALVLYWVFTVRLWFAVDLLVMVTSSRLWNQSQLPWLNSIMYQLRLMLTLKLRRLKGHSYLYANLWRMFICLTLSVGFHGGHPHPPVNEWSKNFDERSHHRWADFSQKGWGGGLMWHQPVWIEAVGCKSRAESVIDFCCVPRSSDSQCSSLIQATSKIFHCPWGIWTPI